MSHTVNFSQRHNGPRESEIGVMLKHINAKSLSELIEQTVPRSITSTAKLDLPQGLTEAEALRKIRTHATQNSVWRSFIGMGYHNCITPPVVQRNILENPGWYTAYTPYQAEISQGRLEALLNFQTMVMDLTQLPVANASLLDEGTAVAEAMAMCFAQKGSQTKNIYFVCEDVHPQTIAVLRTRALPLGIVIQTGRKDAPMPANCFGSVIQYPATDGVIHALGDFVARTHQAGALCTVAADLLSLTLLKAPGEYGADICVGSSQRFGVPMGYGGPHAAFLSCKDEFKRLIPGRIVGVSKDARGKPAARLTLQTREQHIRREKATSNICTAQVLLAVMASMYAVYHGPEGLKDIARRVHQSAFRFAMTLRKRGMKVTTEAFFDTVRVSFASPQDLKLAIARAEQLKINFRTLDAATAAVSFDETTTEADIKDLVFIFSGQTGAIEETPTNIITTDLKRTSPFLTHPVFSLYHSETEMLRYVRRLESKDLSLTTSMIPLGSCTMKLNATAEMIPVTWPEFGQIHPFAPREQAKGYQNLFKELENFLTVITGFPGISLQPNAGSQGEYAGLLVIRQYHLSRGEGHRNICLIPKSAHGTNPASAAMVGYTIIPVECDAGGNIDLSDLKKKAAQHEKNLAAIMVTYPSTHGVFEEGIRELCDVVHQHGGQVYMDGANLNAQVGLCRPVDFGPDVCHLNLHKTFCIPHGGGGPGMGPIGVKEHLKPFLPSHPVVGTGYEAKGIGPVSAAPWGSASILPISWMYIAMMGGEGLRRATEIAILNANYIAARLQPHYKVLYTGKNGRVAHECIIDVRQFKETADVSVEDIAKRLMDYGFHAPTMSWPVAGTLMIEPTESESLQELDRFCEALISIRKEIEAVEQGKASREDNVLKNAPHTIDQVTSSTWSHPYSREVAAFPAAWTRVHKFWPAVARIDNTYGDRNFACSCPPMEDYETPSQGMQTISINRDAIGASVSGKEPASTTFASSRPARS